jgi:hypothetical protein
MPSILGGTALNENPWSGNFPQVAQVLHDEDPLPE